MNTPSLDHGKWLPVTGFVVTLFALVLYLITLSHGAYPSASSSLITTHAGIDPFQSYHNSIWALLLRGMDALPFGTLAFKANLLSVPLCVLSVWLMYYCVSRIPHDRTTEENLSAFSSRKVGAISGGFAAAFLAVSPPFWFIATRAHPMSVNVALLMGCTGLLVHYARSSRKSSLYLFCLLLGIGMVQFPTLILLAPLYGLWLLFLLWKGEELKPARVAGLIGLTLLGYASILVVALGFMKTDTYAYRELGGLGELLLRMIKDQYVSLRRSAPSVGWLSVMLFTILPWFVVVVFPKRALMRRQALVGSYLLHAVMVGVGLLILFNTQIAPYYMLELRSLLVTPYLFAASWMGYLAGYWHIMWTRTRRHEEAYLKSFRGAVSKVHLPVQILTIGLAVWLNAGLISPTHGAAADRVARQYVENLDGRTWLLTNGRLDAMIQLAAHDQGVELNLIDLSRVHLEAYSRYLAAKMEEPRLKSMVDVGVSQLVEEWFRLDPDLHKTLADQISADSWYTMGRVPIPAGVMFLGETEEYVAETDRDMAGDMAFFAELLQDLDLASQVPKSIGSLNSWLRGHVSKVANNTGYYLEEKADTAAAREAYQLARELSEDNISALLNLSALATREEAPDAEALAAEVEEFAEDLDSKLLVSALSYFCGYVRNPRVLYERGLTWALSGRAAAGIRSIERAVDLGGGSPVESVQRTLAALHSQEGNATESEKLYRELLEENPDDIQALLGLARVQMRKREFDLTRSTLARLEELEVRGDVIEVELASVALLTDNPEMAVEHLDRALEISPQNVRAITLRVVLASDAGDEEVVDRYTETLEGLAPTSANAALTLAELAIQNGENDVARAYLEELIERGAVIKAALNMLLTMDLSEGKMDLAAQHVTQYLKLDPRDGRANLILGYILHARGELEQAEAAYRTSHESSPSSQALNNLGWLQVERGAFEEGLDLAREALELDDTDASAWDTAGVALMKLERMDEAEEALLTAVELTGGQAAQVLHLAELYRATGEKAKALNAIQGLGELDKLPEAQAKEANDLLRQLQ